MDSTVALPSNAMNPQVTDESAAITKNHEQIERITYLASLVSRFEDVDAMLDTLRSVTATWNKSAPLSTENAQKLQDLERDLKNYLITKDQVRAFTAESLEQQLKNRGRSGGLMGRSYLNVLEVLGLS